MAALTICSDFEAPKNSLTLFPLFLHLFPMKNFLKLMSDIKPQVQEAQRTSNNKWGGGALFF